MSTDTKRGAMSFAPWPASEGHENYTCIYLHTKGPLTAGHTVVRAHSHEEVSLALNPDQFMETCVTVVRVGRPVNPGTCSHFVYSCDTADQWKYFKVCTYSTMRSLSMFLWMCLLSKIHFGQTLETHLKIWTFFLSSFLMLKRCF